MPTASQLANAPLGNQAEYQRHRPETTVLYRIVEQNWPKLEALLASRDQGLPVYVREEFEGYLRCGRLEHGFMRVACEECREERLVAFSCKGRGFCPSCGAKRMVEGAALLADEILPDQPIRQWVISFPFQLRILLAWHPEWMTEVLGIVWRVLSQRLIRKAGRTQKTARTGAVTLIQRFGSALNLNIHFHILLLDGVYADNGHSKMRFYRVKAPTGQEVRELLEKIVNRVAKRLVKRGVLTRDDENSYLTLDEAEDDPLLQWMGASVNYRIAEGPHRGRKVFSLQTLPERAETKPETEQLAKLSGFSLHAGVMAEAHQTDKREHLCRYITRSAVSEKRLSITANGQVCYQLKTPYRDGTTFKVYDPLDFIARLAALVPKPRVNLTRYHGVFAPNSADRGLITPGKRGRGGLRPRTKEDGETDTPDQRRCRMTWAQGLKRVFRIDVETCDRCGGKTRVIACVKDATVIKAILAHLERKERQPGSDGAGDALGKTGGGELATGRAPPEEAVRYSLFD